jgi:hypothetical protein
MKVARAFQHEVKGHAKRQAGDQLISGRRRARSTSLPERVYGALIPARRNEPPLSRTASDGGLGNFRTCLAGSVPNIIAFAG